MRTPNVVELLTRTDPSCAEEPQLLVPCRLLVGGDELSLFTTLTTFGTPRDITLDELAIEAVLSGRRRHGGDPAQAVNCVHRGGFRNRQSGYSGGVSSNALSEHLLECLKRVAAALRDADVPYALGGGLSAWARGGPPSENDVDILIREDDRERAHRALEALGLRTEVPPEGWLVKAFDEEILIDLIYRPSGLVIDDAFLARCDELSVQAVWMRVMPVDDLLVSKLLSLTEHHLDFGRALEISRALREQVDWAEVRRRTEHSPFARAFLNLVIDLGIAHADTASPTKALAGGT